MELRMSSKELQILFSVSQPSISRVSKKLNIRVTKGLGYTVDEAAQLAQYFYQNIVDDSVRVGVKEFLAANAYEVPKTRKVKKPGRKIDSQHSRQIFATNTLNNYITSHNEAMNKMAEAELLFQKNISKILDVKLVANKGVKKPESKVEKKNKEEVKATAGQKEVQTQEIPTDRIITHEELTTKYKYNKRTIKNLLDKHPDVRMRDAFQRTVRAITNKLPNENDRDMHRRNFITVYNEYHNEHRNRDMSHMNLASCAEDWANVIGFGKDSKCRKPIAYATISNRMNGLVHVLEKLTNAGRFNSRNNSGQNSSSN